MKGLSTNDSDSYLIPSCVIHVYVKFLKTNFAPVEQQALIRKLIQRIKMILWQLLSVNPPKNLQFLIHWFRFRFGFRLRIPCFPYARYCPSLDSSICRLLLLSSWFFRVKTACKPRITFFWCYAYYSHAPRKEIVSRRWLFKHLVNSHVICTLLSS